MDNLFYINPNLEHEQAADFLQLSVVNSLQGLQTAAELERAFTFLPRTFPIFAFAEPSEQNKIWHQLAFHVGHLRIQADGQGDVSKIEVRRRSHDHVKTLVLELDESGLARFVISPQPRRLK